MRCGAIEYCFRVFAGVGRCGFDKPRVTLVASPEAAWDRSPICADFFLYLCESFIVCFSWDVCYRGVMELILDVVRGMNNHFL